MYSNSNVSCGPSFKDPQSSDQRPACGLRAACLQTPALGLRARYWSRSSFVFLRRLRPLLIKRKINLVYWKRSRWFASPFLAAARAHRVIKNWLLLITVWFLSALLHLLVISHKLEDDLTDWVRESVCQGQDGGVILHMVDPPPPSHRKGGFQEDFVFLFVSPMSLSWVRPVTFQAPFPQQQPLFSLTTKGFWILVSEWRVFENPLQRCATLHRRGITCARLHDSYNERYTHVSRHWMFVVFEMNSGQELNRELE